MKFADLYRRIEREQHQCLSVAGRIERISTFEPNSDKKGQIKEIDVTIAIQVAIKLFETLQYSKLLVTGIMNRDVLEVTNLDQTPVRIDSGDGIPRIKTGFLTQPGVPPVLTVVNRILNLHGKSPENRTKSAP